MYIVLIALASLCFPNTSASPDYKTIQNICFGADICNFQRYCDNTTQRCESCSNKFSTCFTTRQEPQCAIYCMLNKPCQPLGPLEHGSKNDTDRNYWLGEVVSITCDEGYHNTGVETTTCSEYGVWSHQEIGVKPPICEANFCRLPRPPEHGQVLFENSTDSIGVGAKVHYRCEEGYKLTSESESQICSINGSWSGIKPICIANSCEAPENPRHGSIEYPRNTTVLAAGITITYNCAVGYRLTGFRTRMCGSNGKWVESEPFCVENKCKVLVNPEHGFILYPANKTIFEAGSDIIYKCEMGYQLQGSERRRCQSGGEWGGKTPTCSPIECSEPDNPTNGYKVLLSDPAFFVSRNVIKFKCNPGYNVNGETTVRCLPNGTWDSDVPVCQAEEEYLWKTLSIALTIACVFLGIMLIGIVIKYMRLRQKKAKLVPGKDERFDFFEEHTEDGEVPLNDISTIDTKNDVSIKNTAVASKGLSPRIESEETRNDTCPKVVEDSRLNIHGYVGNLTCIMGNSNKLQQDKNKNKSVPEPSKEPAKEHKDKKTSPPDTIVSISETVEPQEDESLIVEPDNASLDSRELDCDSNVFVAQETCYSKSDDLDVANVYM